MESQRQASHRFHRPMEARMEKWKTENRFPTFPRALRNHKRGTGFRTKNRLGLPLVGPNKDFQI
jgi:hypothetical protein